MTEQAAGAASPRIITLYNNKGGVSKTTTLFNLAVHLAQGGKRVLIADTDPQCNATELFFASTTLLDDMRRQLPGTSIYEALLPRFTGEASRIDPTRVKLVESGLYPNLFLLRGDVEFAKAESYFANAAIQAITENIHEKNTYVALYNLLADLSGHYSIDYVLCDVGPSTGAITRLTVLACGGFFLPLVPDRFCAQAVSVLVSVLEDWMVRHRQISETFVAYGLQAPAFGRPQFLGAVIQNFKIYAPAKARRSYVKWQERIDAEIRGSLLQSTIPVSTRLIRRRQFTPYVATIRDVGPLAPVAQMFGRAIFDVRREHTREASTTGTAYGGVVWQDWVDREAQYRAEIQHIAVAMDA